MNTLFASYAPQIAALPDHAPLTRADLLTPPFRLWQAGELELFWAPFEHVETQARVVLVGITPGWFQTEQAFRAARDALRAGTPPKAASALARRTASFSGPIRRTLVSMLDTLGVHTALGIESCWQLWGERHDLLHTTALVRYPLFVGGQNYTGYKPDPLKSPLLRPYITETLAGELAQLPHALIVPLGRIVGQGLALLAEQGVIAPGQLLPGLPHPSGANAHRHSQFAAVRESASEAVAAWFAGNAEA